MTRTYLYILGWLLMWLTAVPVQAQNVAGEDEKVGETLPADTLVRDSLSLKWPQSAVHGIDRLLEADMFQASQVGSWSMTSQPTLSSTVTTSGR